MRSAKVNMFFGTGRAASALHLVVAQSELEAPALNENVHHAIDESLAGDTFVGGNLE